MVLKTRFIEELVTHAGVDRPRMLELACGTARHVAPLLPKHPEWTYVGVEPFGPSFARAQDAIGVLPNVTLKKQLAYESVPGLTDASFDIVFSLSALEHIKDLRAFIALSTRYAKPGALVVHRYDLGHALYPGSLKERFQVWLGTHMPVLLGEHSFVRYLGEEEVRGLLTEHGCTIERVTYHDMPNHRGLAKYGDKYGVLAEAIAELDDWEERWGEAASAIALPTREYLFPAVAVWAKKG